MLLTDIPDNGIESIEDLEGVEEEDLKSLGLNFGEKKRVKKLLASDSEDPTCQLGALKRILWDVRARWEGLGIDLNIPKGTIEVC